MPRFPPGWRGLVHRQANRPGSTLQWRPGWRGTGQQPIRRVPIAAYTQKAQGVPLTGGQAQGIIGGFASQSGTATSPTAFTVLTQRTGIPAGTYTINWTVTLSGTVAGAEANNFILFGGPLGNTILAHSVNAAAAGTYPQAPVTTTIAPTDLVGIASGSTNATAGAVYGGTFSSAPPLTLTAGPQGLANIWYPAQVTLSTTTGVLDTSTALVYLGSQGVPITLVASVFSGNGTVALAIPSMSPGQVLIVTWTNGHPGDTAAFNIVGTMDALRAG